MTEVNDFDFIIPTAEKADLPEDKNEKEELNSQPKRKRDIKNAAKAKKVMTESDDSTENSCASLMPEDNDGLDFEIL